MKSPENTKNTPEANQGAIAEKLRTFGIGHMSEQTSFSIESINEADRSEVVDTYGSCVHKIESLITALNNLVTEINKENRGAEVFEDLLDGIKDAQYRTLNQILYHAATNPKEALAALDELSMVLESVNGSIRSPQILTKKEYPSSAAYELKSPGKVEGYDIKSFDALFSKEHIAFNLASSPLYQDTEKNIKSGIRLDYGPLYKESPAGEIDKTKTQWITSVDISGYYIDRIMNEYSPRGHHFTKAFSHKINLLMKSLAEHMERRFDES
jgi:hypothetical protein